MKDVKMVEQLDKTCENCICSVCLIAESNGGAPGCGNCMKCNAKNPVTSCKEFWCPLRFVPYNNEQKGGKLNV